MKKAFLIVLLAISALYAGAQKLDKAKDLLSKKDLNGAKNEIEGVLTNDKTKNNSEAWYVKSKIYMAISKDSSLKTTVPDARNTSFEALNTYLAMEKANVKDSAKRDVAILMDNNAVLADLYLGYNHDAAAYFNANNFNDALTNFQKSLEVFEILRDRKITPVQFDTTSTLYAGVAAEKAKKPDQAAIYYGKIAERKIKSEGFIDIYKWLANYYQEKNDLATSSKFIQLGADVYPDDPFWSAYELDMIREKGSKDDLFKKYEEIVAKDPDNHVFLFNYAVELYQVGYNDTVAKRPANSKELISKSAQLLDKVIQLKPEYAPAQLLRGQIIYAEGLDIDKVNKAIRPAAGAKLKPEELKQKEDLRKAMAAKFDEAVPYFAKVDDLLTPKGKLKSEEKSSLKNSLDFLITIYEQKVTALEQQKRKAETAKNAAELKRIDAELKDVQAKTSDYTDKYNNVDKVH